MPWTRDANGITYGPDGTNVAVLPISSKVTRSDLVERMEQVHRTHFGSTLVFTFTQGVCSWRKTSGETTFIGFGKDAWVVGSSIGPNWRASIQTHPIRQAADLALITGIPSPVSLKCSTLHLKDGTTIELPPQWYWLDEVLGLPPDLKTRDLGARSVRKLMRVDEIRKGDGSKLSQWTRQTGFTTRLLITGTESTPKTSVVGFCFSRQDEWLVLSFPLNSSQSETAEFKTLLAYLRPRLVSRK